MKTMAQMDIMNNAFFDGIHHLNSHRNLQNEKPFLWQQKAKEVIKVHKPKCVVLDLDFTMWPTFYSSHTLPPYVPLGGDTPSQVLCVDKKTHKPRILALYAEVQEAINFCLENDIMVSIASKNSNTEDAQQILRAFGLWNRLHFPQIFHNRKTYHFRNLKSITGYNYEDFLFFDDDVKNVSTCKNIGVTSVLVRRCNGFNGKRLLEGLVACAEKHDRRIGSRSIGRVSVEAEADMDEEYDVDSDLPAALPSLAAGRNDSCASNGSVDSSDGEDESHGLYV